MTKKLTALQASLLALAKSGDLSNKTYREIAELVQDRHPYTVQQAISSLIGKGLIIKNSYTGIVSATSDDSSSQRLIEIPVMGYVSCGSATALAAGMPMGSISVSPNTAKIPKPKITYALIASGESMSRADINGKSVEEGDYVIVEKRSWGEANNGEYVVSRFNDMNNLKKLTIDQLNRRVILQSESHENNSPIIISEDDIQYFAIEGVAKDVIKGLPRELDGI